MSYLELIKLALPEAVVVITALVVLAVGLTTSRRTGTTCSSIAVLGLTGAIGILGLPRDGFNTDRLPDFVRRFEERTGERALISDADVAGESTYDHSNA